MPAEAFTIEPIDLRNAADREYADLHRCTLELRAEAFPEDAPTTPADAAAAWRATATDLTPAAWVVRDAPGEQVVAFGEAYLLESDPVQADFRIGVLPAYRRRGLARRLLAEIVAFTEQHGRRRLGTDTNDRVPAGAAFLERIGGQARLWAHFNQLRLAELNRDVLDQWLAAARPLEERIALERWDGPCPEERLVEFTRMLELIQMDIPADDLKLDKIRYTPERVRAEEQSRLADGTQRWALAAIDRASGALAGLTELFRHPNHPAMMQQDFTGVLREYRRQGIGRWLKAAMIARVLAERPEVELIRTFNADSNDPMMSINHALGFRRYLAQATWQVETDAIRRYLAGTPADESQAHSAQPVALR